MGQHTQRRRTDSRKLEVKEEVKELNMMTMQTDEKERCRWGGPKEKEEEKKRRKRGGRQRAIYACSKGRRAARSSRSQIGPMGTQDQTESGPAISTEGGDDDTVC